MKHAKLYITLTIIIVLNIVYVFMPKSTINFYTDEYRVVSNDYEEARKGFCVAEEIFELKKSFYIRTDNCSVYYMVWKISAIKEGATEAHLYRARYQDKDNLQEDDLVDVVTITVDENNNFVEEYTFKYIFNVYRFNVCIIIMCCFAMLLSKCMIFKNVKGREAFISILLRSLYFIMLVSFLIFYEFQLYSILVVATGMILRRLFIVLDRKNTLLFNVLFTVVTMLLLAHIYLFYHCTHMIFIPVFLFAAVGVVLCYINHMKQMLKNSEKYLTDVECELVLENSVICRWYACGIKYKNKLPKEGRIWLSMLSYILWFVLLLLIIHFRA